MKKSLEFMVNYAKRYGLNAFIEGNHIVASGINGAIRTSSFDSLRKFVAGAK